ELARAEVRLRHAVFRDRVENAIAPKLVIELVDALDENAAARGAGDEGLGAGTHRPLERLTLTPRLVGSLPEVDDGVVASEHREAVVVMEHLEAKPVAVELNRGGRVVARKRRDRLTQPAPR